MTNRTESEQLLPGGKGINVSAVLHNLGIETTVLGFIAGFTGEEIRRRLEAMGMGHRLITLPQGMSRINVKLKNIDGTEINAKGPDIDKKSLDRLYEMLDVPGSGDVFVHRCGGFFAFRGGQRRPLGCDKFNFMVKCNRLKEWKIRFGGRLRGDIP